MMTGSLRMIAKSSISPTSGSKKDVLLAEMVTGEASLSCGNKTHATG